MTDKLCDAIADVITDMMVEMKATQDIVKKQATDAVVLRKTVKEYGELLAKVAEMLNTGIINTEEATDKYLNVSVWEKYDADHYNALMGILERFGTNEDAKQK